MSVKKEVFMFSYKALTEVNEQNWKDIISAWLRLDPEVSIPVDFGNEKNYTEINVDSRTGWVYEAKSNVGSEPQTLHVLNIKDDCMVGLIESTSPKTGKYTYAKYLEYDCVKKQFNYGVTDKELREMPEVISYLVDNYGIKAMQPDPLSEFLSIPRRISAADNTLLKRFEIASNREEPPIVYVPLNDNNEPALDIDRLAKMLCGTAHVVSPASKRVSEILKGCAFPYDKITLMNVDGETASTMPIKGASLFQITSFVFTRTNFQEYFTFFDNLKRIHQMCEQASVQTMVKLLEEADNTIKEKDAQIEELKNEINKLNSKLEYLQQHTSIGKTDESMFKMTESIIYEGEVKDMLLKLCQKEYDVRKNDPEMRDWRRTYLLKDIIDNNESSGNDDVIISALKDAFSSRGAYVTDSIARSIGKYGFKLEKLNGGHCSITLNDDDRLKSVMASTGSDNRGAKNFISDYVNKLFR